MPGEEAQEDDPREGDLIGNEPVGNEPKGNAPGQEVFSGDDVFEPVPIAYAPEDAAVPEVQDNEEYATPKKKFRRMNAFEEPLPADTQEGELPADTQAGGDSPRSDATTLIMGETPKAG